MKAWVLNSVGDFSLKEVDTPKIKSNEVLVKIHACGICGSDIPRAFIDGAHKMPLIIGHEFSGEVVSAGEKVSNTWQGKRVGIFPLIPCMECEACKNKLYEMCQSYSYLGSRADGGFAQFVAVPEWNLIELPQNVTFEQAAMLEPTAVAVHAVRQMDINKKDTIVVCGLGTIGLLITMYLKSKGYKNILTIGNKDLQKQKIIELGIEEDCYCDSRNSKVDEWIKLHTNSHGADVFFECVGKNDTILEAVDLAAIGGKICLVGNPHSDICFDKKIYWKILRKQLTLTGTWNSSFTKQENDDWHLVVNGLENDILHPEKLITHRFSIDEIDKGFAIMRDKSEEYVKIICH